MTNSTQQMNKPTGRHRLAATRPRLRGIVAVAALAAGATSLPMLTGTASAAPAAAKATVIIAGPTSFGTALEVGGSVPLAGHVVYFITSDHGTTFGCTSGPTKTPFGPIACTGPTNGKSEWPAITTTGAPVAGADVSQKLLGMVKRSFGEQVTYAGHPLYQFNDVYAGSASGEGWDEPSLPPWHGLWNLIAPSGRAAPWVGTLTTTTIGKKTVLAAAMNTALGVINFPVYSYSKDTSVKSTCTGSCAIAWPPMLTSGTPGVAKGLSSRKVGTLHGSSGTQVSYGGKPLYFFSDEGLKPTSSGIAPTGSGNGISVGGGTFSLIKA
jgi:predicted lipoprotein with Yx(FWY)xxD motif